MKLTLIAVGRLKAGPERELSSRYVDRAIAAGRSIGLEIAIKEIPEAKEANAAQRKTREAEAILSACSDGARIIALDEHGKTHDSPRFAALIGTWRDDGEKDVVIAIGGPDGHGKALLSRADLKLAFGAMTWPHQLARIMASEQIYRAVTILSGHPYHRV